MIKNKASLIPRYNWDYSFKDFMKALKGAFIKREKDHDEKFEWPIGGEPIFTTSGRTSLYIILKALELPEGTGVGVPLFCCHVVFDAIKEANMVPIFIDINEDDYCMSAEDLRKKRDQLGAIVVVHMFGHPADMDAIKKIAEDIPIIEDCAQSLFSKYKGEFTGRLSEASFFSFRSGKYVSIGEGSLILCQETELRRKVIALVKNLDEWTALQLMMHCLSTLIKSTLYHRPWYGMLGYPVGMWLDKKANLTAKAGFRYKKIPNGDMVLLRDRLKNIKSKIERQRKNALLLKSKFNSQKIILSDEKAGCWSNYYQFVVRFPSIQIRDSIADKLFKQGIDTAKYLDDIVDISVQEHGYDNTCPISEEVSKRILAIPNYYTLNTMHMEYIANALNEIKISTNGNKDNT